MASVLETLRGKKKVFFLLVCGYVLVLVVWQLQSSYRPLLSSSMGVAQHDVYVWTQNVSDLYKSGDFPVLDIHIEDPTLGHTGEVIGGHSHHIPQAERNLTIAIGGGITSAKIKGLTAANIATKVPLFKHLVPSFCKTVSPGYHYHFYLGYDNTDPFFTKPDFLKAFQASFFQCIKTKCPAVLHKSIHIHLIQCSHSRKPAWAQNDAMVEAYIDDIEYYYRLNDDTEMQTGEWVQAFIKTLQAYNPPLVGVVGPKHRGGNEGILTYDFVHKTHVDIFGFYYPRLFTDWWADDWITKVYQPGRSTKMANIHLKHTMELGQRYRTSIAVGAKVKGQIEADKKTLIRYLQARESHGHVLPDSKKVISMSLYGKDPKYTMGVVRNAQLIPVFLPEWTFRVYTADPKSHSPDLIVPERILDKLRSLRVQLAFVNPTKVTIPPAMWSMLIAEDMDVDYFLVREAYHRVSDRDAAAVDFWLQTKRPFLSIKDQPAHTKLAVVKGLWGGRPPHLLNLLGDSLYSTLQKGLVNESAANNGGLLQKIGSLLTQSPQEDILSKHLWPLVANWSLSLDSINCETSPGSFPFPANWTKGEYVGQEYNDHEQLVKPISDISRPLACSKSDLKPSDVPAAPPMPERRSHAAPGTGTVTDGVRVSNVTQTGHSNTNASDARSLPTTPAINGSLANTSNAKNSPRKNLTLAEINHQSSDQTTQNSSEQTSDMKKDKS